MATIIIFASSLFISSALVLIKAIELKYGRRNFLLDIISRLDSHSDKFVLSVKFRSLQLIQSIRYIILVQIKNFSKKLFEKVEEKLVNEYRTRQKIIMGRKEIVNKGSVSFYLKKITEHKGNGEKGKIEDSLP